MLLKRERIKGNMEVVGTLSLVGWQRPRVSGTAMKPHSYCTFQQLSIFSLRILNESSIEEALFSTNLNINT